MAKDDHLTSKQPVDARPSEQLLAEALELFEDYVRNRHNGNIAWWNDCFAYNAMVRIETMKRQAKELRTATCP